MIKKVDINMSLCERLVNHLEALRRVLDSPLFQVGIVCLKKNHGDVLFKRKVKTMHMDDNLQKAFKAMDSEALDILSLKEWQCTNIAAEMYKDFTTLKLALHE
jgi:hypothetical protein